MAQQIDLDAANNALKVGIPLQGNVSPLTFKRSTFSVAGSADVTPTSDQYSCFILSLTGVLTGDISLILPLTESGCWIIDNRTSGAHTITVKGATGTGEVCGQTAAALFFCDGTNFHRATTG